MSELARRISEKIREAGPICFSEFMAMALYCPDLGFYEGEKDRVGHRGDFVTSVSAGPVFGVLIALQVLHWAKEMDLGGGERPLTIIEAGADRGQLASDILQWFQKHAPDFWEKLEYWVVEPSAKRRAIQESSLAPFANKVRWANTLHRVAEPNFGSIEGILLANELLDAMPVHRLRWNKGEHAWIELGVTEAQNAFSWTVLGRTCPGLQGLSPLRDTPEELLAVLPDGFSIEASTAAVSWWGEAARLLKRGVLLTFDYGLESDEFLSPSRSQGTLRGYRRHSYAQDVLAGPGEQDITAHVNFTAIREAGHSAGLRTLFQKRQGNYLVSLAEQYWNSDLPRWSAREIGQFRSITHPEGLGRAMQVLAQAR